jgi:hypothetical protein
LDTNNLFACFKYIVINFLFIYFLFLFCVQELRRAHKPTPPAGAVFGRPSEQSEGVSDLMANKFQAEWIADQLAKQQQQH